MRNFSHTPTLTLKPGACSEQNEPMPVASVLGCVKSGSPETVLQVSGLPLYCEGCCGGVLLSHTLPGAVPSALAGLASRFGMEAGRFPAAMTTTRLVNQYSLKSPSVWGFVLVVIRIVATSTLSCLSTIRCIRLWLMIVVSVGPLVPVGSRAPRGASTSGLSTR